MVFCAAYFLAYTLYIENALNKYTPRGEFPSQTSGSLLRRCFWNGPVSQYSIYVRSVVYILSHRCKFACESTFFASDCLDFDGRFAVGYCFFSVRHHRGCDLHRVDFLTSLVGPT